MNYNIKNIAIKLSEFTEIYSDDNDLNDLLGLKSIRVGREEYYLGYYIELNNLYLLKMNINEINCNNKAFVLDRDKYLKSVHPQLYSINFLYDKIDSNLELTNEDLLRYNKLDYLIK